MHCRAILLCWLFPAALACAAATYGRDEREQAILNRIFQNLEDRLQAVERRVGTEKVPPEGRAFTVTWKDRLVFATTDNRFRLSLGGLVQNDWAFMTQDGRMRNRIGAYEDGTEFRRARIAFQGRLWENVIFKAQYDFAGGQAAFKDVYLGLADLPFFDRVLVGQIKEPFSSSILTDAGETVFLERSLPATTLAPNRNTGVLLERRVLEERLGLALGAFHDTDAFGNGVNDNESEYSVAARLNAVVLKNNEGDQLSASAAYRYAQPPDDTVEFSSRPEAHLAPVVVDTGPVSARHLHQADVAGVVVWQRYWAQSEYIYTFVDRPYGSDPQFSGVTVSAGGFLTGERRQVKNGVFTRVRPLRNFLQDGGLGAWEIAGRYSFVGLNDAGVSGGRMQTATAALNWYLTPVVRVMLNYVYVKRRCHGEAHVVAFRFQVEL